METAKKETESGGTATHRLVGCEPIGDGEAGVEPEAQDEDVARAVLVHVL